MWSTFDKFLASVITSALLWLNQKYGFKISTDPETVAAIVGLIVAAVTFIVPNKEKA